MNKTIKSYNIHEKIRMKILILKTRDIAVGYAINGGTLKKLNEHLSKLNDISVSFLGYKLKL